MELASQFINRIDLRSRLRHLFVTERYDYPGDKEFSIPVFTDTELEEEPIKWLKYLLLDRSGVESLDTIRGQIFRFSTNSVGEAELWANERLRMASASRRQTMIVAKLIPWDQGAQLKNYRMLSAA